MPSNRQISYGLMGTGLLMAVAGRYEVSVLSGVVAQIVGLTGLGLGFIGGVYYARGNDSDSEWRTHVISAVGAIGLFAFIVFAGETPFSTRVEIALSTLGLVLLFVSALWQRRASPAPAYDERQLRIRYRAAYAAFWIVSVLLGLVIVATAAVTQPTDDRSSVVAVTLVLAAGLPLFTGGLAFKIAEGYYERQM